MRLRFGSQKKRENIIFLFMYLATLNFIGRFFYWYFLGFCIVFLLTIKKKIHLEYNYILLGIVGFSILLFGDTEFGLTNILKPFIYLFAFFIGSNINLLKPENESYEKQFIYVSILIAIGSFSHLMLNMLYNWNNISIYRNTIDFWSKEELSATSQASFGVLAVAVSIPLLWSNIKLMKKVLAVVVLAFTLIYNLTLAGRTLVLISFVVIAISVVMKVIVDKYPFYAIMKIFAVFLLVFVVCFFLFSNNVFGMRGFIEKSTLWSRFFSTDATMSLQQDTRLEYRKLYLSNMYDSIWGGSTIYNSTHHYAHDLLLDAYDESGIFTLVALVLVLILTIRKVFIVVFTDIYSGMFRIITPCIFGAIFIEFLIEPIFAGYQWFFAAFCILDAMLGSVIRNQRVSMDAISQKKVVNNGR